MTDATAGVHRGARQRGGVANGGAGTADPREASMRQTAAAFTAGVLLCYPCPSWSQDRPTTLIAICDEAAAIPLDQSRPTGVAGVATEKIDPKIAIPACDA